MMSDNVEFAEHKQSSKRDCPDGNCDFHYAHQDIFKVHLRKTSRFR